MLRVTDTQLPYLECSLPCGILDVYTLLPRDMLDRIGEPLREASLLRIVVFAESLVVDVPARHDVVLGRRDRKELTESFSMFLDEAGRSLAVRSGTIANRVDHPAFNVVETLGILPPFRSAPRGCTPARFTPVIGISVALFGLVLVSRKVGVSQDLPDLFKGEFVVIHCILQQCIQCFDHCVCFATLSKKALSLPLEVFDLRVSTVEESLDIHQLHPRRPVDDNPLDTHAVLARIEPVVRPAPRGGSEKALRLPVVQRSHRQRESLSDLSDRVESGVVTHDNDSDP